MKQSYPIFYMIKGIVVFAAFLLVVQLFPSGGILTRDGRLTEFWIIPAVFFGLAFIFEQAVEANITLYTWVFSLYSSLASGTWLGLSFGALLILNEWYANPGNGTFEPLFAATGLSSAGVLAAERRVKRLVKEKL